MFRFRPPAAAVSALRWRGADTFVLDVPPPVWAAAVRSLCRHVQLGARERAQVASEHNLNKREISYFAQRCSTTA